MEQQRWQRSAGGCGLNQLQGLARALWPLLGLKASTCLACPCPMVLADEGFGVGHTRVTQTKGVWMWGEPTPVNVGGRTVNVSGACCWQLL